jgi:hypothetical protein
MTMIDYLLLGGFAAASVYTVYRLFVGFRNSSSADLQAETTDEPKSTVTLPNNLPTGSTTGAPWHRPN